jgi:predicted amidophosphoribosyltransferase
MGVSHTTFTVTKCKDCGAGVADDAGACSNCGAPTVTPVYTAISLAFVFIVWLMMVLTILLLA